MRYDSMLTKYKKTWNLLSKIDQFHTHNFPQESVLVIKKIYILSYELNISSPFSYSLLEIYKIIELELLIFLYTVPFFARFLTIQNVTRDRILVVRKLISESLLTVIYMYHTETLWTDLSKKLVKRRQKSGWLFLHYIFF